MDIPWNPAVLEKRIARIYRMWQKKCIFLLPTWYPRAPSSIGFYRYSYCNSKLQWRPEFWAMDRIVFSWVKTGSNNLYNPTPGRVIEWGITSSGLKRI